MRKRLLVLMMAIAAVTLLSACGETAEPTATPDSSDAPVAGPTLAPVEVTTDEPAVPTADAAEATAYPAPEVPAVPTSDVAGYPAPVVPTVAAPDAAGYPAPGGSDTPSDTLVVPFITVSQQEGPYYPVEKPADRDNDLTVLAGAAGSPQGEVLEFSGLVMDSNGVPVRFPTVVEIWQADANGIYMHPDDPDTDQRDMNFQFYGESVTDSNGRYSFRTIVPGEYEPRPRHIHFKVILNDEVLLTSQFYFEGGPFGPSGQDPSLVITVSEGQDAAGNTIYTAERDIILSRDLSSR